MLYDENLLNGEQAKIDECYTQIGLRYYAYHKDNPAPEFADLIAAIRKADLCEDKRAAFGKKFMEACDGHATEKTCAWLFDGFIEETAGNTPAEKQR